jgi:6-phosphogluconolactonase
MSLSNVHIIDQNDHLAEKFGFYLEEIVQDLISKKSLITIGLSGGSLIDILASILPRLQFPWARIRFFFVDERFVPFTSDDSTFTSYQQKLFRQLPLTEKNIIKIDPTLSIEQAAKDYQIKLEEILQDDQDHVESLF